MISLVLADLSRFGACEAAKFCEINRGYPRSSLQKLLYLVPWEVFRALGENGNSRRRLARQIQFGLLQ